MHTGFSHLMTRPTKWTCTQWRLRSAWASIQSNQSSLCAQWVPKDPISLHADSEDWSDWASAQSDQSLCCALNGNLRTQSLFMRTVKTLIRLGICPGWSESSLGAHAILLVLSWGRSVLLLLLWHLSVSDTTFYPVFLKPLWLSIQSLKSVCTSMQYDQFYLSAWRNFASLAIQNARSEDSDQTAGLCTGRMCSKVRFPTLRLKYISIDQYTISNRRPW